MKSVVTFSEAHHVELRSGDGGKHRLLIVDDDQEMLSVLQNLFLQEGYLVEVSHNGKEAISKCRDAVFDIIVTDIIMPGASGLDVLREVKKIRPETLVILITGFASLETAIKAIREGAYDYITKPFKLEQLNVAVRNAAEKVSLSRENKRLIQELKKAYEELRLVRKIVTSDPDTRQDKAKKTLIAGNLPHLAISGGLQPSGSFVDYLERLSNLKDKGFITDEEFELCKKKLFQVST